MPFGLSAAIAAIREEFFVECADGAPLLQEPHQLNDEVCRIKQGFEPDAGEPEVDVCHQRVCHAVVRHRASKHVAGTVGLVLPAADTVEHILPMQRACPSLLLSRPGIRDTAEVSRFLLSQHLRTMGRASRGLLLLSLMRGVALLLHRHRVKQLCALMEPSLLRLLRTTGVHFQAVGAAVEYHGIRQPVIGTVAELFDRMRSSQPAVWDFVTDGGRLTNQDDDPDLMWFAEEANRFTTRTDIDNRGATHSMQRPSA